MNKRHLFIFFGAIVMRIAIPGDWWRGSLLAIGTAMLIEGWANHD